MKKPLKAVLIIISVLLIVCVAIGIWQRENIFAVFDAVKYSQEDISTLLTDNEKIVSEALIEYPELNITDIDGDGIKALEEGKITQEEMIDIVMGKTSFKEVMKKKEENKNSEGASAGKEYNLPETSGTSSSAGNDNVAKIVAKMYILKNSYIGRLDSLIGQAVSEFDALPPEKRTSAAKQRILASKVSRARGLESECNGRVEAVLAELANELKAQGKDLSLVSSIRKAYANEKQLRKSYYISKYLK